MTNFKVGDVAWFFDTSWERRIPLIDFDLFMEEMDTEELCELFNEADEGIYFHSKREALNALSARLKEFLDEEEPIKAACCSVHAGSYQHCTD